MRQSSSPVTSSVASSAILSKSAALHSVLQAALENLDVQLEEELTRYRRQRRLQPETLQRRPGFIRANSAQDQAIDLPQFPLGAAAPVAAADTAQAIEAIAAPASDSFLPDSIDQDNAAPAAIAPVNSFQSIDAAAPLTVLPADLAAPQPPPLEPAADEDYFASSEELLRSIAEEAPQPAAAQSDRLLDTLLTPLGIGSLLLLLLSTATLGYLVMNPASLKFLVRQQSPEIMPADAPAQPAASPAAIEPLSPDLAAKEFVDLNLNTLSSLPKPSPKAPPQPSPSPSPQTASKPLEPIVPPAANLSPLPPVSVPAQPAIIAPAPANPRPVSRPARSAPSQSYESSPAPVSRPAAPEPEPVSEPAPRAASPTPEIAASPARSDLYHVVTPYRSDAELNQVQQSVPDAYVRNFSDGARVQMGAFSDESKAEELVQELQQQGIQAEVRQQN